MNPHQLIDARMDVDFRPVILSSILDRSLTLALLVENDEPSVPESPSSQRFHCAFEQTHRAQSARLSIHPQGSVAPPPWVKGGETHSLGGGGAWGTQFRQWGGNFGALGIL
jgi:hypothetical protein